MGIVKTKAIILRESNMGDYDKMLTMLAPGLRQDILYRKGCKEAK